MDENSVNVTSIRRWFLVSCALLAVCLVLLLLSAAALSQTWVLLFGLSGIAALVGYFLIVLYKFSCPACGRRQRQANLIRHGMHCPFCGVRFIEE